MTHEEQQKRRKAIAEYMRVYDVTVGEVARHFSVCFATVYEACREHRVEWSSGPQKRREAIAEYVRTNDATPYEAAAQFKVGPKTIRVACRMLGVQPRLDEQAVMAKGTNSFAVVAMLQNDTTTPNQVASKLGITRQRVSQIKLAAEQAGIRFPNRRGMK